LRIAIGGIMHESNTFARRRTTLADFAQAGLHRGKEIISAWEGTHHEIGGFIEGAQRFGYQLCPLLMTSATPSGPVCTETFEMLANELVERLLSAGNVDGLLLALHGAMVCESFLDADGEIVRRLRVAMGETFPLVVTHDFHANISERIVNDSTALIVYKTNPHLDQRERGLQAAEIITRVVQREVYPVQVIVKPPMLFNIRFHNTNLPPLSLLMDQLRTLECEHQEVLAASFAAGYQFADVPEMGPSVVIVTDRDRAFAQQAARRIATMLWEQRHSLVVDLPEASEAVRLAMKENSPPPTILVEMGDNIGGGAPGDSTCLLGELIRQGATRWLVVLCDPEAVRQCMAAGIGCEVELMVGGKADELSGSPIGVRGRVRSLHDGVFAEFAPRHGGARWHNQGLTAVLRISSGHAADDSFLVLTSRPQAPFSLQQILSLGIDPAQMKIIVVKAAVAFRAAYEPIAGRIIEVDTPGVTCVNPQRFEWQHVRRPLWGLDHSSQQVNDREERNVI